MRVVSMQSMHIETLAEIKIFLKLRAKESISSSPIVFLMEDAIHLREPREVSSRDVRYKRGHPFLQPPKPS